MIASFKAIFFDAGGTLFHPYPSVGQIYQEVARRYDCEADAHFLETAFHEAWLKRDGLAAFVSHSSEKIEKKWWRDLVHEVFSLVGGVKEFEAFFEELYDLFANPHVWRLYPETLAVLKALKKKRKCLGIISNWDSRLFKLCDGLGISDYLDFVLASAVFGASKPNFRIFQEALFRARVSPEEAVHVGDSLEDDVRGAQSAGMRAILIDRKEKPRTVEGEKFGRVRIIRSLSELIA